MAGTITTDLVDVSAAESATDAGTWARIAGATSSNPAVEGDGKIQGAACLTNKCSTTVTPTDVGGSLVLTATHDLTGQHLFSWRNVTTPANMNTKANQGVCLQLGSDATYPGANYKRWFLSGSDIDIIGGWTCYVLDPAGTADASTGTLNIAALKTLGFVCRQLTGVGTTLNNHFVDAVRRGTGLTVVDGTDGTPVTFSDVLAWDNANARAWGILTAYSEGLFGAGKFRIGTTGQTAVTRFKDTDKNLTFRNFPVADSFYEFVLNGTATFNTIFQLGNYSGGVASGGCNISVAGARWWNLTVNANSKALIYASKLNRLRQATLTGTSELRTCTVTNSGTIDTNGAVLSGCAFAGHTATQLKIDSATEMAQVTKCSFTSGGVGYAIEATATGDYTLDGLTFSGYGADGTTTAAFYNNSGGVINISLAGGAGTPTVKNGAGATTNFVTNYQVSVNGLVTGSRVKVTKTSDGTVLFNDVETNGSISFMTTYTGEVRIEARKASASPYYQPWVTIGTIGSGLSATALQVRDDQ